MGKTISIRFGEEYKAINHAEVNDVFAKQYKIAEKCLEEIVSANKKTDVTEEYGNCINNIIAFTGDRGQGKTSAMMTFVNSLKSDTRFAQLEVIDPSTFENMHNVVEVIVTKMYNKIKEKVENNTIYKTENVYLQINDIFQKVYESLSLVRNPNKFDDLEQDYEGTIQKIVRAGDSAQLKYHMIDLVDRYLKFISETSQEKTERNFLMIQIDDIDINISLVYKMTEQIRKYLIIPNVIIIMAVKIEQLKFCIELQFRKEMSKLNHNQQEPVAMAAKYVEKLIPDGRKIVLPELRLLAGDDEQDVEERNKIEYIRDNKNILAKYKGHGLESTVLGYIYEQTGLHFIKRTGRVHPIMPNTLRELVNLMSVLGKLEPCDKLNNLVVFENYFFGTWIPNNLDEGYAIVLRRIHSTDYLSINRTVCDILLEKLDKLTIYTLDTKLDDNKSKKFNQIKEYFRDKNANVVSLGDTQELIHFFEEYYIDEEPKLFSFALQTLYSIVMNKLAIISPERLYNFIQGSIWGHTIIYRNMSYQYSEEPKVQYSIQTKGSARQSRTYFGYNSRNIVFPQGIMPDDEEIHLSISILNEIDKATLTDLLFFSNFNQGFIRRNWSIDEKPMFSLENLFISSVFPECIKKKIANNIQYGMLSRDYGEYLNLDILSQITTNVELAAFILEYISKSTSQLHDREEKEMDHFIRLIDNIDMALCIEAYAHGGQAVSIFRNDEGRNWIINTYMRFWGERIMVYVPEITKLIPWLKDNKLGRTCKISTFSYRFEVITGILSEHEKILGIVEINNIKNELNRLYAEDQVHSDKISRETKGKYNQLCDELIKTFESNLGKEE